LRSLLSEENRALLENNIEQLGELCDAKLDAARRLEQLDERLRQIAPDLRGDRDQAGAWLQQQDQGGQLLSCWRTLGEFAKECRERNQANGALLDARSGQVRNALQALRPAPAATYGPSGTSSYDLTSRISGHA